jgi:hypothetical protein
MSVNTDCKPGTAVPAACPHKGYKGYHLIPQPPKPTDPDALAYAIGEVMVAVMQDHAMPLDRAVKEVYQKLPFRMDREELRQQIIDISALWRDDKGPDVPKWEPPKPVEPTPVVIEDPKDPKDPEPVEGPK